eukprot:UN31649
MQRATSIDNAHSSNRLSPNSHRRQYSTTIGETSDLINQKRVPSKDPSLTDLPQTAIITPKSKKPQSGIIFTQHGNHKNFHKSPESYKYNKPDLNRVPSVPQFRHPSINKYNSKKLRSTSTASHQEAFRQRSGGYSRRGTNYSRRGTANSNLYDPYGSRSSLFPNSYNYEGSQLSDLYRRQLTSSYQSRTSSIYSDSYIIQGPPTVLRNLQIAMDQRQSVLY